MSGPPTLLDLMPVGYGYIIFVAVSSIFLNLWLGYNVMKARKQFKVKYPKMYSDSSEVFNCVQRAHHNWLETYPQFLVLLFIGGLYLPRVTAAAGVVCLIGRIAYAKGYYTGEPQKRVPGGGLFYVGLLIMLVTTVCAASQQLHWIPKNLFG